MRSILILLVRGYQIVLSPWIGQSCRFNPTCSNYAIGALKEHGALKGSWMAISRIGRCHPWHEGGEDPVPPKIKR
ncbi:MAG: membrane protein insertion efficiency factor YidD [Gammaproteobacteria bacterium]|nr:membrane protein insertion efficiency factor YidD [Gammaproteobacteria bacterium]MBT3490381.1 membrane protein insertion efficiency factor YidD [Gammaproteobacteria bacterium]MBT3717312.1 membrane protein insertion efficiency factor YidD [Gammaproteobacteria bacterium]MBT3845270.1 membrane protein insertion efficiency factor YidD [Gammaproteobacteria bacterium]MBT3893224.1 membrane protein insertion efficiency factor YidD [Gammaproteobacteria bacterium]